MRIALDFHDVLADLGTAWVAVLNEQRGTAYTREDVRDWKPWRCLPIEKRAFYDFLAKRGDETLAPIPGAIAGVKQLVADGHDVAIVTASRDPQGVKRWLEKHGLRGLHVYAVASADPAAAKLALGFDVYVDDNPNLVDRRVVRFDAPWNRQTPLADGQPFATCWSEVVEIVKEQDFVATITGTCPQP